MRCWLQSASYFDEMLKGGLGFDEEGTFSRQAALQPVLCSDMYSDADAASLFGQISHKKSNLPCRFSMKWPEIALQYEINLHSTKVKRGH